MAWNENWGAANAKAKGDKIALRLELAGYGGGNEHLAEGIVTKVTAATVSYTMEGALRDGDVQLRAGWRGARENEGLIIIDGERYKFTIATPRHVARITDPNRELRESLDDALRDLRHCRKVSTRDDITGLIGELDAAKKAAKALLDALESAAIDA